MLKKFFLQTLSSFVGAWLAMVLFAAAAVIVVIGLVARIGGDADVPSVKKDTVLKLELQGEIAEIESPSRPDYQSLIAGDFKVPQTLSSIVASLREGAENENVRLLYISCQGVMASPATLDALRHEVVKFKSKGKKVYAYGDVISNADYFIASVADSIFMNPAGQLYLKGLGSTSIYMKSLLDKLGVSFQVVKVGTFKSAVEPYIMDQMSEPARAQLDTLFTNMWSYIRKNISSTRKGVTPESIDKAINDSCIFYAPASEAVRSGFVDRLVYGRQIKSILAKAVDVEEDKLNILTTSELRAESSSQMSYSVKNQIAVLYACGEIADGSDSGINYETLVPQIVELAEDENIKGMVLRVNSPGGSAYGSEQIGEALDYFMSKGKPLAVSMGDYAASGGYWISCRADRIYADALTITGSIGIFGLIPNVKNLTDKLGVYPQNVNTNPGSDFPSLYKPMDERQLQVMQKYVDRGYEQFVGRVAKGRKMKVADVKRIAEGRVWDAMTAVKIGLVDSIGYLENAIAWTAQKAEIADDYETRVYPKFEPSVWDMIAGGSGNPFTSVMLEAASGNYEALMARAAKEILGRKPVQMRMIPLRVSM